MIFRFAASMMIRCQSLFLSGVYIYIHRFIYTYIIKYINIYIMNIYLWLWQETSVQGAMAANYCRIMYISDMNYSVSGY